MSSALQWLDVSSEQQRRVRELIRLFEEPGTRDELGIGSIRDAFSDLLFPGTSVIQTRARYFLFIPWHFQEAAKRGLRGQAMLDHVESSQRQLITKYQQADFRVGLIGNRVGRTVRTLPSTIYWNGLGTLGILTAKVSPREVASMRASLEQEQDEYENRVVGPWHPTIPRAPKGFPNADSGGFDLTRAEAEWLRERIVTNAPETLYAFMLERTEAIVGAVSPWHEPLANVPDQLHNTLQLARRFSCLMHGAALVYNLLVSERYDKEGFSGIDSRVEWYTDKITTWAKDFASEDWSAWDWPAFWQVARSGNPRITESARSFAEDWFSLARIHGAEVATDDAARALVSNRVTKLRGGRSVLVNMKLLGLWQGSSSADALNYRWGTVKTLIGDIQAGLARARA